MPFSHDQPDNAARCRRIGVAATIRRDRYNSEAAARELEKLFANPGSAQQAKKAAAIVASERGPQAACDAIDDVLKN
jgi:UDP:flavonoid glycosyltransferase YjiC (YdhE family)